MRVFYTKWDANAFLNEITAIKLQTERNYGYKGVNAKITHAKKGRG